MNYAVLYFRRRRKSLPIPSRDAPELRFFKVSVPAGTHENVRPEPELFASHV